MGWQERGAGYGGCGEGERLIAFEDCVCYDWAGIRRFIAGKVKQKLFFKEFIKDQAY